MKVEIQKLENGFVIHRAGAIGGISTYAQTLEAAKDWAIKIIADLKEEDIGLM